MEVRRSDGNGVAQQVVDVQGHAAVAARRRGFPARAAARYRKRPTSVRLCSDSASRPVAESREAGQGATAVDPMSRYGASGSITTGSASTGIDAMPHAWTPERRRPLAGRVARRRPRPARFRRIAGPRRCTPEPCSSGIAAAAPPDSERSASRSTAGSWARWARAPTTTPEGPGSSLISSTGQGLSSGLGFCDQRGQIRFGVVSAGDQGLSQPARPFDSASLR